MKLSLLFCVALGAGMQLQAQTNTFPPSGNTGIGTLTPAAALSIRSADSSLSLSRSANPNIQFYDDGTGSIGQIYYDSTQLLHLGTAGGTDALTLNLGSGNVGIGTTTPGARLEVNGNATVDGNMFSNGAGIGRSPLPVGTVFCVVKTDTAGSAVMADFGYNTTASGADSGALRAVANNSGSGSASIRAGEFQTLREAGASANNTWGIEIGVHSQVPGNGDSLNLGAYIASSHGGWLPSGTRADTGIYITGEDGWNYAFKYYDTDGTTLLSSIDQYGNIFGAGALTCNKIGVGTASPLYPLDVAGVGRFFGTAGGDDSVQLSAGGVAAGKSAVTIGYNQTYNGVTMTDAGYIQAETQGTAYRNLLLEPMGGNVGIGTISPSYPLTVNGTIRASEIITNSYDWADYVFDKNYRLSSLADVERTIRSEKHLPGMPSAEEIAAHGLNMGEMQTKLLQKIEELTLHQIEQEKRLDEQAQKIERLEKENTSLQAIQREIF